jgi:hypothetical protein
MGIIIIIIIVVVEQRQRRRPLLQQIQAARVQELDVLPPVHAGGDRAGVHRAETSLAEAAFEVGEVRSQRDVVVAAAVRRSRRRTTTTRCAAAAAASRSYRRRRKGESIAIPPPQLDQVRQYRVLEIAPDCVRVVWIAAQPPGGGRPRL